MKKAILLAAAAVIAMSAGAQNKAIDALAEKYADTDGFTIVNLEGEALRSMSSMIGNGNGTIDTGDGKTHKMSELLEEIVSVTAIIRKRTDEAFTREVKEAVAAAKYEPVMTSNEEGQRVKVVSTSIRRGKLRGNKEIVAVIDGGDEMIVVRVIGRIDTDLLAKIVAKS